MSNYYDDSRNNNVIPIIKVGEVTSIADTTKSGRIKVRIVGVDDLETENSLIDCVPLLPKYLVTLPQPGESVFVFQYESSLSTPTSQFKNKRFWIGPLITQPTKLEGESYTESLSILPDGYGKLKDPKIETGAYGNDEDITLQGRFNTDIIQKDRQIWLRAGKFIEGENNKFNDKDLGYIQIKYGSSKLKRVVIEKQIESFVQQSPTKSITVILNTINNDSIILSPDLPSIEDYSGEQINRTEVFIQVKDFKTGDIITSFENETSFIGTNSREQALTAAKSFIDGNKGDRWIIKSTSNDIINDYGGGNGSAIFGSKPIKVTKTVKEVQFTKGESAESSVINVVANKINLLSHDGVKRFEVTNPESLITDDEQQKINNEAQPLVYGTNLVNFLELLKKYVSSHVHPYNGLEPDKGSVTTDVTNFNLDTLLNKNINSN
jgi:hypothetical protein